MKITSNLISLILKLVGGILLITGVLNYIFATIPGQWEELDWKINLVNSFVDQGIIPLMGIGVLFLAWWIEDNHSQNKISLPLRFVVLIVTCLLGLFFLLLIPLHMSNVNKVSDELISTLSKQVQQQQAQLDGFIAQLEGASKNPELLKKEIEQRKQVIESGGVIQGKQLNNEQLQLLSNETQQLEEILTLSKTPDKLQTTLAERKNTLLAQIKEKENQERKKAKEVALQQTLKTSVISLILAIAYTVIGWFGLREILSQKSS